MAHNGRSRQNVDRVPSLKNLIKDEIFVRFHSNLGILTEYQKPCDTVWIRYWLKQLCFWYEILRSCPPPPPP